MISTCGIVYAQFPPIPSDYSGYVTVNGEPAPDGAIVYAKIEDYTSDSVAVADLGRYRILSVKPTDGTYIEEIIEFYVDPDGGGPMPAVMAFETDEFEPGTSHDPFNLTVVIVDVTPPVIVNISPSEVTTSGAKITWITDEPSTSQVEYGGTASYGSVTDLDPALVTSHSVGLAGLVEGTTYHFRVVCADEAGNTARSGDRTFTTATTSPQPQPPPPMPPSPTNEAPVADAGPDKTVYVDVAIHLSGAGSQDPDGTIEVYHWFFGDGGYKSGVKVMHVYGEAGVYTASLAVTDNNGATGTDNCTVTVLSMPAPLTALVFVDIPANSTGYVVDASSWADTTVKVNTTDPVTVTVIRYEANPHPGDPMPGEGVPKYADVFVSDPDAVDWPIYVEMAYTDEEIEGLEESSLGMYYWMDGAWHRCSDTGVDAGRNVVWAYMTREEASGSPILVGGMPSIITPPLPPMLSGFAIMPEEVELGGNVTVSVVVTNVDVQSFVYIVSLRIGDEVILLDVALEGGVSVPLEYVVHPEAVGTYDVWVDGINGSFVVTALVVPLPAEFEVSGLEVSPGEVSVGEEVSMTVAVANVGEEEDTYEVIFVVDGEVSEIVDVTLGGGASTVVAFAVSKDVSGIYDVGVGGLSGVFRVLRPAEFECSDLEVSPVEVEEGEEVTITVDVCNVGEEEGSHRLELVLDGSVVEEETVAVEGGAEVTVSFVVTEAVGTHEVDIGGLTGSFAVTASQNPFPLSYVMVIGAVVIVAVALMAKKYMG